MVTGCSKASKKSGDYLLIGAARPDGLTCLDIVW